MNYATLSIGVLFVFVSQASLLITIHLVLLMFFLVISSCKSFILPVKTIVTQYYLRNAIACITDG